jgi:hypothetical protein
MLYQRGAGVYRDIWQPEAGRCIIEGMTDDPLIPSEQDGMPTAEAPSRKGRAWQVLTSTNLVPEYERHPAATGLHQLADIEAAAHSTALQTARRARMLGLAGTTLTLLALALAAAAGFGSLGDVVGQRTAAIIALASAVASAISAFVQSKSSGDALRTEAQVWSRQADDVLDSLVLIVSHTPMPASEMRQLTLEALEQAREREPGRAPTGAGRSGYQAST